jgi:hypothetical protein
MPINFGIFSKNQIDKWSIITHDRLLELGFVYHEERVLEGKSEYGLGTFIDQKINYYNDIIFFTYSSHQIDYQSYLKIKIEYYQLIRIVRSLLSFFTTIN